jgi:hypothetical protein
LSSCHPVVVSAVMVDVLPPSPVAELVEIDITHQIVPRRPVRCMIAMR